MTSCTECKNNSYCPAWKSIAINIRNKVERVEPINYLTVAAKRITAGESQAETCKKFQKNIFFV